MAIQLKPLNQQVIVITGASSGIGLCTAQLAAKRGAKVVLAARSAQTLDGIVQRINAAGGEAISVVCDVADRDQVEQVAQTALKHFGRIDTWVNNAGVAIFGRLDQIHDKDNRRLFETNFWGIVNGSLTAISILRAKGGALINLGSEASEAVAPMLGMYSTSKHAVKGFTDALRVEIEQVDQAPVSITLIQPTAVNTPFDRHAKNYMDKEPNLPNPMIQPEQVAEAILSAAVKPVRDVKVGMMAKVNTFVSKNMPSLADHMAGKMVDKFQRDDAPHDPEGTLFIPGEGGEAHGDHASA
jgi:short-subunit dehydrogenase